MLIAIDFAWDLHISELTSKAVGIDEILRRDLSFAFRLTKAAAYEILFKPKLEYFIYLTCAS